MARRSSLRKPRFRGRVTLPVRVRRCPNCGEPVSGNFCANCGQRNTTRLVSIRRMAMEALEDQFSVNATLPRTLHGLLFRPGFLTREYLAGRIARYIPPFRLFLVTSLLFFALFPVLTSVGQFAEDAVERGAREADAARTKDNQNVKNVNFGIDTTRLPNWLRPITRPVIRQEDRLNRMETRQVGRELLAGLARNVPRAVFLLLPIFALILKLLYLRQKRLYVGHFVFALHVHAFAFLLFTLALHYE